MEEDQPEDNVIHSLFDRKVIRISDDRVRKSGPNLRAHEAPTLRFIAAMTTIPVPKVHDVNVQDGKVTAITMDYVPGNQLDKVWENLDSNQKLSVAEQLHGYVSQLRDLKGDYIGAIDRGNAVIGQRFAMECGPFDSEEAFNDFILSDIASRAPGLLRHYAKHALSEGHEIVFTHGDLAPRNVLVDENCRVTALLDWEYAGWYPEHWEYIKALSDMFSMPDWSDYLSTILPYKYEKEYIGMSWLSRLLRH